MNTNFSPKILLKQAFHNKKALSKKTHRQYIRPFPNKKSRYGLLKIGKSLVGSSDWYEQQWEQIKRIKDKPFLVLWGENDPFINSSYLAIWMEKLSNKKLHRFEAGHFLQEEKFEECLAKIEPWLQAND